MAGEAVTNSVLHAGLSDRDAVHVDAWWAGDRLRVEVCDEGAGIDAPSPAGARDGGHGLRLIERLSTRWGLHSDGHTRVWFEVSR